MERDFSYHELVRHELQVLWAVVRSFSRARVYRHHVFMRHALRIHRLISSSLNHTRRAAKGAMDEPSTRGEAVTRKEELERRGMSKKKAAKTTSTSTTTKKKIKRPLSVIAVIRSSLVSAGLAALKEVTARRVDTMPLAMVLLAIYSRLRATLVPSRLVEVEDETRVLRLRRDVVRVFDVRRPAAAEDINSLERSTSRRTGNRSRKANDIEMAASRGATIGDILGHLSRADGARQVPAGRPERKRCNERKQNRER